jgi:dUTP pyrophosphatase
MSNEQDFIDTQVVQVKILENFKDLELPKYATLHSAGMDLMAAIEEPVVLKPFIPHAIPTGISMALPDGYEAQIRPRSGLAIKNSITVANAPGTIDADYRGEVKVALINFSQDDFVIERGMRIAQMVVAPYTRVEWELVKDLSETTRGTGGFGSTGMRNILEGKKANDA